MLARAKIEKAHIGRANLPVLEAFSRAGPSVIFSGTGVFSCHSTQHVHTWTGENYSTADGNHATSGFSYLDIPQCLVLSSCEANRILEQLIGSVEVIFDHSTHGRAIS